VRTRSSESRWRWAVTASLLFHKHLGLEEETEVVFQKIDELIKSGKLNNRDRFALMDLMDLKRDNKW
jgi:hypothetical protein